MPLRAQITTSVSSKGPETQAKLFLKSRPILSFKLPQPFFQNTHTHTLYATPSHNHTIIRLISSPKGQEAALDQPSHEVWIQLAKRSSKAHIIWSDLVDPIDPIVELSLRDLDQDGSFEVTQTKRSPHPTLCGSRAWTGFFPDVWDFRKRRFVHAPPLSKATRDTPLIQSTEHSDTPTTSRFSSLSQFHSASSNLNHNSRAPRNLSDQDPSTLWSEDIEGWGLGSFVNARINPLAPLHSLHIHTPTTTTYASPSLLLLTFSDNTALQVRLKPNTSKHFIQLPKPIRTSCLSATLLAVYTPTKKSPHTRSAIADITPISSLDLETPEQASQTLINTILQQPNTPHLTQLSALLNDLPRDYTSKLILNTLDNALKTPKPSLRPIIPLLAVLPDSEGKIFIERILKAPKTTQQDLFTLQRTLALHTPHLTPTLFDIALSPPKTTAPNITRETIQERAILVLSRSCPPDQIHRFIPLLGVGSPSMRRAAIRTLSRAPLSIAPNILEAASKDPDADSAHDALWALERVLKRAPLARPENLTNTAQLHTIYQNTSKPQTRIRVLKTLKRLHDPTSIPFLSSVLHSKDDVELRTLAARNLSTYSQDSSTQTLLRALEDTSPTIRLEAITALRSRAHLREVSQAAVSYTKREAWPQGLKSAYELLARSPFEDAIDTLYNAIARTSSKQSIAALHALFRSRKNIRSQPLSNIAKDTKVHRDVRLKAIKTLTWTHDDLSFNTLLNIAQNPDDPIPLRNAALRALGQRSEQRAVPHLLHIAKTTQHVRLQMTAARVLAFSTSKETAFELRKLEPKVSNRVKKVIQQSIQILETRNSLKTTREKLKNN